MLRVSIAPSEFDREEREIEFSRALAFSDGVFAFAITLLVTTIDVPHLSGPNVEHQFVHRLDDLAPQLFSYFLSFAVIGLMWLRHHRLFSRIRRMNPTTLVLNLVALAFVVLMPFTTNVIGEYGDVPAAVGIYALNIALAGLAFTALWWHCVRGGLLAEHPTRAQIQAELRVRLGLSVIFLLSIPLAYLSTTAAELSWLSVAVFQRILRRDASEGRIDPEDA
jgi:uncharacterized membrane protein